MNQEFKNKIKKRLYEELLNDDVTIPLTTPADLNPTLPPEFKQPPKPKIPTRPNWGDFVTPPQAPKIPVPQYTPIIPELGKPPTRRFYG